MDVLPPFDLQRALPLPLQIATHLRDQIQQGRWSAGQRLPTARELAGQLQTDAATIHRALVHLTREGLVERKRRAGTFVRQHRPVLETVGVYVSAGNMGHGTAPFLQAVIAAIHAELRRVRLDTRFLIDPRPKASQATPWELLVEAATRRNIQALIVPSSDQAHSAWLTKLPLPLALFTSGPQRTLEVDLIQFMDLAVAALAGQGCRRIGMISAYPVERTAAYSHFLNVAVDHGLQVRDEWLAIAPVHFFAERGCAGHHPYGYERFLALWEQAERPDGLIVTPDSVASGVILALAARGVRIPQELRLVLQRNRGVPLLCPFPATILELDPAEAAACLVRQVRDGHAGRAIEVASLRYTQAPVEKPERVTRPPTPVTTAVVNQSGKSSTP